ncbi:MAG: tRNA nucleotidyltransferase [Oscillospiraceae bacterium]|jgi:tRNA nucleotidyltransferase (CCA-adding enzyme)|nr:tRNA nucleotidyltransferase [Oscillospiraceae bacterium]
MRTEITVHPDATKLIECLNGAGFAAFAVGGCVRDALRGADPHDWDLSTAATPEQMHQALRGFDLRDTGLKHGTITAILRGRHYEITTFRVDGGYTDNRRPDSVLFVTDAEQDLSRRDFTINAMAYHPQEGLIDPFGGAADLRRGVVRAVGEPQKRFDEDALRILRALRFASVLDFAIDTQTSEAISAQKYLLKNVAAERIESELRKLLLGKRAGGVLEAYLPVAQVVLPVPQTLNAAMINALPQNILQRYAVLFWDSAQEDREEAIRFLRLPKREQRHLQSIWALQAADFSENAPPRIKKNLGQYGDAFLDYLIITKQDEILATTRRLLEENACTAIAQLQIDGYDLQALGLSKKQIGQALRELLDDVICARVPNEKAALIAYYQAKRGIL